jgi:hypothetical protein
MERSESSARGERNIRVSIAHIAGMREGVTDLLERATPLIGARTPVI